MNGPLLSGNVSRAVVAGIVGILIAPPMWSYVTKRGIANNSIFQIKWDSNSFPLTWQMNSIQNTNVSGSISQEAIFKSAFAAWQNLSTASVSFVEGPATDHTPGVDGINLITTNVSAADYPTGLLGYTTITWVEGPGAVAGDPVNPPRIANFAGQIIEADIQFNPSIPFSTDSVTPLDKYDLQSVATHEVGHLLGLDHTTALSSVMFWTLTSGANYARVLSADDIAGISTIYPSAAFSSKGTISGTVRTTGNAPVYGAIVTVLNSNGQPVATTVTDPNGNYTVTGLDVGSYTVYARPLAGPTSLNDIPTLKSIYVDANLNPLSAFTNFTVRFR